ncbi:MULTISPECIES: hypothetical protein [unclassified Nitrosomonas]|uniref:hypothetical protein n=1 Tax=unclassified Nitrosomonas TaxID=2609265 RepID=UPI00089D4B82|nr:MULTISPECIES: hypothetical protein [unclassified Nitrosomonas]MDV6345439.1 hypothetical protein [Nitrosomonas sp. Is37]SDY57727.1 hypothetical protein SAMN05421755_103112 [Nitrosomonas sp. Nm33]
MIRNPRTKRILSISLFIIGCVFILLAPEDAWLGVVLLSIGLGVEIGALIFRHRK